MYKTDFKSYMKFILGRRLMYHANEHRINDKQLYGSRKGVSAHDAVLTTRLIYDMARMTRTNIVSIFNDLKGNYDRVRPSLNTITTRRMGLPCGPAVCHAMALSSCNTLSGQDMESWTFIYYGV